MSNGKDFGPIFYLHTTLELIEWFLFLLVDWQILLSLLILLEIQYAVFGGCVLARAEFGKGKNYTFTWYYLVKIFPNLDPKKTTWVLRYIIPILVLVLAVYIQVFTGYVPVLHLIK
ncbi:MAG: hypothetical protein WCK29_01135 [archaeon]